MLFKHLFPLQPRPIPRAVQTDGPKIGASDIKIEALDVSTFRRLLIRVYPFLGGWVDKDLSVNREVLRPCVLAMPL